MIDSASLGVNFARIAAHRLVGGGHVHDAQRPAGRGKYEVLLPDDDPAPSRVPLGVETVVGYHVPPEERSDSAFDGALDLAARAAVAGVQRLPDRLRVEIDALLGQEAAPGGIGVGGGRGGFDEGARNRGDLVPPVTALRVDGKGALALELAPGFGLPGVDGLEGHTGDVGPGSAVAGGDSGRRDAYVDDHRARGGEQGAHERPRGHAADPGAESAARCTGRRGELGPCCRGSAHRS